MRKWMIIGFGLFMAGSIGTYIATTSYVRSSINQLPEQVKESLKSHGITFKYRSAIEHESALGLRFKNVEVYGDTLPYRFLAKDFDFKFYPRISWPIFQLKIHLTKPLITKNRSYVPSANTNTQDNSQKIGKYISWFGTLVRLELTTRDGDIPPHGLQDVDFRMAFGEIGIDDDNSLIAKCFLNLSVASLSKKQKPKTAPSEDIHLIKTRRFVDAKLPIFSFNGVLALSQNLLSTKDAIVSIGPLIANLQSQYDHKTSKWDLKTTIPETTLNHKSRKIIPDLLAGVKSLTGTLKLNLEASGQGANFDAIRSKGNFFARNVQFDSENPKIDGKGTVDINMDLFKEERLTIVGDVRADLTDTKLDDGKNFLKKSGVPLKLMMRIEDSQDQKSKLKGHLRFHNLDLLLRGKLALEDSIPSQITFSIPKFNLKGWNHLFQRYGSISTFGELSSKMVYNGPLLDWRKSKINLSVIASNFTFPVIEDWLPPSDLAIEGVAKLSTKTTISYANEMLKTLKTDTFLDLSRNRINYKGKFSKRMGIPLSTRIKLVSDVETATFKDSNIILGTLKTRLEGNIENFENPRLNLKFNSNFAKLSDLVQLSPTREIKNVKQLRGLYAIQGAVEGLVPFGKSERPPKMVGQLNLREMGLNYKVGEKKQFIRINDITGPIDFTLKSLSSKNLRVALPRTKGNIAFSAAGTEKPDIKFRLKAKRLSVKDFYSPTKEAQGAIGVVTVPVANPSKETDFRENPLLKKLKIKGSLEIEQADLGWEKAKNLTANIHYDRLLLNISPLKMTVLGGTLTSNTIWNGQKKVPVTTQSVSVKGVDANRFISAWSKDFKNIVYGKLNTSIDLRLSGLTAKEMKESVAGSGTYLLKDGEIKTLRFSKKPIETLQKIPGLRRSLKRTSWNEKFKEASGSFTIEAGKLLFPKLQIQTSYFNIDGNNIQVGLDQTISGRVNWRPKASLIGNDLKNALKDQTGTPNIPLLVSGPLRSPGVSVEDQGLQKRLAKYAAAQAQKRAVAEVKKSKPVKQLEDSLKKGLNNFFQ